MSLKMSKLIELLKDFNQDNDVIIDRASPLGMTSLSNGNTYISLTRKIAECNECGYAVYAMREYHGGEYCAYCPECDAHKTEFQITKIKL